MTTPPKSEVASNVKKLVAPPNPKPNSSSKVEKTVPPKSESVSNVAPQKTEAQKSVTKEDVPGKPEAVSKV